MKINRDIIIESLKEFVSTGNGIVVGRPGVGKTYLIADLCDRLDKDFVPNLFLQIDRLGNATPEELQEALHFDGDLIEKIHSEFSQVKKLPGVLIFDAFDATRNEVARRNIVKLIESALSKLKKICHVIVTVRTYDAQKSQELLDLFGGFAESDASEYRDSSILCRHFSVPLLTDPEIEQAVKQISHLEELYQTAAPEFKELLRIPFNLWLLEKTLTEAGDVKEISTIRSEIQLLSLFWRKRIKSKIDVDARELLLSIAAKEMVKERMLSIKKEILYELYGAKYPGTWDGLLSDEILTKVSSTGQRLAFSHNILFDYAVSVLLIEDLPEKFFAFVSEDVARPVFLRPSLFYYFARLWYEAPDIFWKVFEYILSKDDINIRLVARFMPTRVIVSEVRNLEEISPLFISIEKGETTAIEAMLRLLQAHKALNITKDNLWVNILEKASRNIRREFVWDLATTTGTILERAFKNGEEGLKEICGKIGRNLFNWIWQKRLEDTPQKAWDDRLGAIWVVPIVARTFGFNTSESKQLLEKVLELIKEPHFPIDYFYRLVDKIDYIWPYDPEFVAKIYLTVLSYYEGSEEITPMGTPVMPLSSTRRQDYNMCQYILIKKFPKFLLINPMNAITAAIWILNKFIVEKHVMGYLKEGVKIEEIIEEFIFHGGTARYLPDSSFIWDESEYIDEPIKMADDLFAFIEKTAEDKNTKLLDEILDNFRENIIVAFFWKRLLKSASKFPDIFAQRLFDLCIARPILTNDDVIYELGLFLESASPVFKPEQIAIIEKLVMELPKGVEDEHSLKYLTRRRDRLLARIPKDLLQIDESKRIVLQMEKEQKIPENKPLAIFTSWSGPYTYKERFKEKGIDIEDPNIKIIVDYYDPLGKFESEWQNKKPTIEAVHEILPQLQKLFSILQETTIDKEIVLEKAWTELTACCKKISYSVDDIESDAFKFARHILLLSAKHPSPEPDAEYDASFTSPAWSPAPRIEAAQGLPWIALRNPDAEVLSAIKTLVHDKVPRVRFLIVEELWRISNKALDVFWELARYTAENEENEVVQTALCHSLNRIIGTKENEDKAVVLFEILLTHALSKNGESEVLEPLVETAIGLHLERDNEWAIKTLQRFLVEPVRFARELKHATFRTFDYLKPGKKNIEVTDRAIKWLSDAVDASEKGIKEVSKPTTENGLKEAETKVTELYGVIDEIVMRLYFACKGKEPINHQQLKEYYYKIKPLLEKILTFASDQQSGILAARTAHNFMEFLGGVTMYDPEGVLYLATGVVQSSKRAGYNLDSMAISETVKLVESLLADHREIFREEDALRNLVTILDIFAEAGWPEALSLIWRLDEVFR
jgi:hypothetical protein